MQHDRVLPDLRALSRGWIRPRKLGIIEFAHKHIKLPASYSQEGDLDLTTSRYLIDPLLSCANPNVRETSVLKAVKMGGTMIAEIAQAYWLCTSPGPAMWTQQSDDDAKEHMKGRGWAFFKGIQPFRAMLPVGKRHDISDTTVYFGDFALWVNGANKNSLQSKDIRYKTNSELWLWKQGLLEMAKGRVTAFERQGISHVLNESHASVAGTDWESDWLRTDQRTWCVPCPKCKTVRPLEFFGRMDDDPETRACVVWDKECERPDGSFDEDRLRRSTRYRCAKCGHESEDTGATRVAWNDGGEYRRQRHDAPPEKEGYRFNALPSHPMKQMSAQFRHALESVKRGDREPLKLLYIQKLQIFWKEDEQREKITIQTSGYTLREVAQNPAAKINNEAARVLVADVQRDHFWVIILAFRTDGSIRLLFRSKVITREAIEEIRTSYDVRRRLTFLDAGGSPGGVYDICAQNDYTALIGSGRNSFIHGTGSKRKHLLYSPSEKAQAPRGGFARYVFWASDPIKDMVHAALSGTGVKLELPDDIDDGDDPKMCFTYQCQGEVKRETLNKKTGRMELRWHKTHANHYWDCLAMGFDGGIMIGCIHSGEAEGVEEDDAKVDDAPLGNGADSQS